MSRRHVLFLILAAMVLIPSRAFAGGTLPDVAGRSVSSLQAASPGGSAPLREYPQLPGWPQVMGVHPNYSPGEGPATVDIDGDHVMEVFAGSTNQQFYAWNIDGSSLPGFPKTVSGMVQSSPAVGDIDGDGAPEILVATSTGRAYAYRADGSTVPGWPKTPGGSVAFNSIVLADLDGVGPLEVILAAGNYLYVWHGDGSNLPGFPALFQSAYGACSAPAVGDLDGDGHLEIVVEGWEWLTVFRDDGTVRPGWPVHLPLSYDGFSYSAPALVDFDGDGQVEICAGYHESGGGTWAGKACIWRNDGTVAPGWPYVMADFGSWTYSTPAAGDVDEDGRPEFAMTSHNGNLYLFEYDGTLVPGFPVQTGYYNAEASCAIADVDDDGHLEICLAGNESPTTYAAYERDGTMTPGFPLAMVSGMMVSGSCIGDFNNDGSQEICAHTRSGYVYLWDLPSSYHPYRDPWPRPHHDDHHTGLYAVVDPAGTPQMDAEGAANGDAPWGFLSVYPNPTSGPVQARIITRPGERVRLTLIDPAGRVLRRYDEGALTSGRAQGIDLALAPASGSGGGRAASGVWYLRLEGEGRTQTRPVCVLR